MANVHKWVGLGRVQSFVLVLGRVRKLHLWVGSRKLNARLTQIWFSGPVDAALITVGLYWSKIALQCAWENEDDEK